VILVALMAIPWGAGATTGPSRTPGVAPSGPPVHGAPIAPTVSTAATPAPHADAAPSGAAGIPLWLRPGGLLSWTGGFGGHPQLRPPTAEVATPGAAPATTGTIFLSNGTAFPGLTGAFEIGLPYAVAYDPASGKVLVDGYYSGTVGSFDPSTHALSAVAYTTTLVSPPVYLPVSDGPMVYDSANGHAYLASPAGNWIDSIIVANGSLDRELNFGFGPGEPSALAVDPADSLLFMADAVNDSVAFIDTTTLSVVQNVSVGTTPDALLYDSSTGLLIVANEASDSLTVVNVSARTVAGTVGVGDGPQALLTFPGSRTVWSLNGLSDNITLVDEFALQSVLSIALPAGEPTSLVADTRNGLVDVLNVPVGGISILNGTTGGTAATLTGVGRTPYAGTFDPVRNEVLIADIGANALVVVNSSHSVASFVLGAAPSASVFDPATSTLYVADVASAALQVYDGVTERWIGSIALPAPAFNLVFAASAGLIAAIQVDGNVSFVSPLSNTIAGHWGPDNGTTLYYGTFGNGEFVFSGFNPNPSQKYQVYIVASSGLSEVRCIGVGQSVGPLAYDPTNHYVYAGATTHVSVISTASNQIVSTLTTPTSGSYVTALAYNPVASSLLVGDTVVGFAEVDVYNITTSTWTPSPADAGLGWITAVDFETSTDTAYVADGFFDTWATLQETGSGSFIVANGSTGNSPVGATYSTLSGLLYFADLGGGTLELIPVGSASSLPFVLSLTVSPTTILLGGTVYLNVTATFPVWDDHITFPAGLPPGCASANTSTLACTPTATGTFNPTVTATNPFGANKSSSATFAVFTTLVFGSFTATPTAFTLGTSTTFAVSYTGGIPPITIDYPTRPAGCADSTLANWTCTPSDAGNQSVGVTIDDSVGTHVAANLTITVNPHLAIVSFAPSVPSVLTGSSVTFSVVVTGGTGPFSIVYAGLPGGCSSTSVTDLTCTPNQAGIFPIVVKVTDADGVLATDSTTLIVSQVAAAGPSAGLTTPEILGIVAVVAIIAVAIVLIATRRRPTPPPGGAAGAPPAPAPPADDDDEGGPRELEEMIVQAPPKETMMSSEPLPTPKPAPPRYYSDPGSQVMPPPAPPVPGAGRAPLVCPSCGTSNEPWLTTCRKCKRALQTTSG